MQTDERLVGLTYAEARARPIPPRTELVEDLIDIGTVGIIAGLPFARKSWLAQELAHKVAARKGDLLGRFAILDGGPVVYVWQDDSTPKELERIQVYGDRHGWPKRLPLRYVLNEGVRLPDHVEALRELVDRDGAVLLVLDSLYNLLSPNVPLKDEGAATVLAALKHGLCDATDCTVAVVDHAPWPTDSNRGQRRAYGSVFKTAAIRWAIHLEADPKDGARLHVEASGNNVAGFRRTPALFDDDTLEIRLIDAQAVHNEELEARVLEHIVAQPGDSQRGIERAVTGSAQSIRETLQRLVGTGRITRCASKDLGRTGRGMHYFLNNHAPLQCVPSNGTHPDAPTSQAERCVYPSPPRRGDAPPRDAHANTNASELDNRELEHLEALQQELGL